MEKLSQTKIKQQLKEMDGWEYTDNAIHTSMEFPHFKEAFSVMTRIAFEAEAQQHHPEWTNIYNKLFISLSTHDADGVTQKDFDLARAIEKIIETE